MTRSSTLKFNRPQWGGFQGVALRIGLFALVARGLLIPVPVVQAAEFHDTIEKDISLRSLGELRVTNSRGDITIDGWAQDRVRLKALRTAQADNQQEADLLLSHTDLQFKTVDQDIELSAEYGRGMTIEERLKERRSPKVSMDLNVLAPSNLSLNVWAVNGKVVIKGWNAHLEVRSTQGPVRIETVHGGSVSVLCPSCSIQVKSVHAPVRCMGGSGAITISDVNGSPIYVESGSGNVSLDRVQGKQLYVTKSGSIHGKRLNGRIEFHTQQGSVKVEDSSGFISGRTESGSVSAWMKDWSFLDQALIESISGNITLALPASFAGEVDLRSGTGKVSSMFPLTTPSEARAQAHLKEKSVRRPFTRLMGLVNRGGEQLKLTSETGNVSLLRSDRTP